MDESFFSYKSILQQNKSFRSVKHEEKGCCFLVNLYSFSSKNKEAEYTNHSHANEWCAKEALETLKI